jgi:hypothetical protein
MGFNIKGIAYDCELHWVIQNFKSFACNNVGSVTFGSSDGPCPKTQIRLRCKVVTQTSVMVSLLNSGVARITIDNFALILQDIKVSI